MFRTWPCQHAQHLGTSTGSQTGLLAQAGCNQTLIFSKTGPHLQATTTITISRWAQSQQICIYMNAKSRQYWGAGKLSSIRDWTRLAHKKQWKSRKSRWIPLKVLKSMVGLAWSGGPWNEFCGCSCICGTCRWRGFSICHMSFGDVESE